MKLDKELINRIAFNARIKLEDEEAEELIPQLQEILNTFSQIKNVDTTNTEPSFHPIKIKPFMREDVVGKSLTQTEALKNTEHKKDGYFKGPKALSP